jgi:hypothetical protein
MGVAFLEVDFRVFVSSGRGVDCSLGVDNTPLDSLFVKTNVFLPTLILSLFLSLIFSLPSICLPFIENGLPFNQKIKN